VGDRFGVIFIGVLFSLLKGAELCHLRKPIKSRFGGGLKEFSFDEAQCFAGVEMKTTFISGLERSAIVRQMIEMIRAPVGGLRLKVVSNDNEVVLNILEGRAIGNIRVTVLLLRRVLFWI
jgi:anoctamin-8